MSEAQMYVTLTRLEKGGFVERLDAPAQRSDRKVYGLTPAGQERVTEWMSGLSWPRVFAALATVLDARRASAVTLALGATPRQVRAGLVTAQVIPAWPGAIVGVPLGIGLFEVAGHGLHGLPPAGWLVAAVLGTVLVVAALTSVPARIGGRRPVAEMLQSEAA